MNRSVLVCGCTLLCLLFATPAAEAAECGSRPEGQTEPLVGMLLLRPELTNSELDFSRDTGEKRLIFVFGVSGCSLESSNGLVARPHSSEMEVSKVFGEATFEAEGSQLIVELPVHGGEFSPGKHSASISIHGATVVPWISKASVQRTEGIFWPATVGIVALVVAFLAGLFAAKASSNQAANRTLFRLAGAFVAAAIAGGAVWISGYLKVEVWTGDVNSWITLGAGILAAGFGATVGSILKKASGGD